jgi:hypothetical protein
VLLSWRPCVAEDTIRPCNPDINPEALGWSVVGEISVYYRDDEKDDNDDDEDDDDEMMMMMIMMIVCPRFTGSLALDVTGQNHHGYFEDRSTFNLPTCLVKSRHGMTNPLYLQHLYFTHRLRRNTQVTLAVSCFTLPFIF